MGAAYSHTCGTCGHSVSTSGPWEFYRDAAGERHEYGHPVPVSEEAARAGIAGLSAELWCPHCDRVHDLVVVEFEQPAGSGFEAWAGGAMPKEEYRREGAVRCPDCGAVDLVLGESEQADCLRCGGGMRSEMAWIS